MTGTVFSGFIFGTVSLIMFGIGICQYRSRNPATFYTGEVPHSADELDDVSAWNHSHGLMWILYGILILLSWLIMDRMGDTMLAVIPLLVGVLLPLPFIILFHKYLCKKHLIDQREKI